MSIRSLTNTAAARATGVLTVTGNAVAGESVTVGTIIYTFAASMTLPYQVLIGAAATNTLDNLKAAINDSAGEGTLYGPGTLPHSLVTATTKTATQLTVQAISPGAAGNSIASTESMSAGSFAAATLAGGLENSDLLIKTAAATGASVAIDDLVATDWRIELTIHALTAAKKARFSFPDSVDAFSASLPGPAFAFVGPIDKQTVVSVDWRRFPALRLGVGSAVMRCNLDAIDSAASITYSANLVSV